MKSNTIVMFGSLREDMYIKYDFSKAMEQMEVKTDSYSSNIGGSVFNTARYISEYLGLHTIFYTPNYKLLLSRLYEEKINQKICFLTEKINRNIHPISIIGVDDTGEKRMVSSDGANTLDMEFISPQVNGQIFYTSFYEINEYTYKKINELFSLFRKYNKYSAVDLCPIIGEIDSDIVNDILSNVSILIGAEKEYDTLMQKLDIISPYDIFKKYHNISMIWRKRGENGAEVFLNENNNYCSISSCCDRIITVKNTNGCGDVFNATVLYGLVNKNSINDILNSAVETGTLIAERGLPWIKNF